MAENTELREYWFENEQQEKLKKIQQMMRVVNNPGCQAILHSLNGNPCRTCEEIHTNRLEKDLDTGRGYQNLKKLSELNFITHINKNGSNCYSLNIESLGDFIDCIRLNLPNDVVINNTKCLEIVYNEDNTTNKYVLDFKQTENILSSVNCLLNDNLRTILRFILNKNNYADYTIAIDTKLKQYNLSRNLRTLAGCNLIKRVSEKNYRINSINTKYLSCLSAFLKVIGRTEFENYEPQKRKIKMRKVFLKPNNSN